MMKELRQSIVYNLGEQADTAHEAQNEGALDRQVLVVQTVGKVKEEGAEWYILNGLDKGVKLFGPHCDKDAIGSLKQSDPLVVVTNRDLKPENSDRKDVVTAAITQREGRVLYVTPGYDVENNSPGNMPLTTTYQRYG